MDEDVYVHPTAVIDDGAAIGTGSRVWHFVHVCADAVVGSGVVLGQGVYVGPGVHVGDGCRVQNHVSIYAGVTLEDEVFVGPSAVFTNVKTPRAHVSRMDALIPTLVKRRATIGANSTIVCGVTIGEGAFVGAGAVVASDVPPRALVLGVPARVVGAVCDCGERLSDDLTCLRCGDTYTRRADGGVDPEHRA